ncbi:hypothetical protein F2P44_19460 [Massilia sp. CCM 8695]|uniref:Uncharacterized protein n=1 Tax=Massilia frigida TaxID=2609281 RepID=A0ABX0N7Q7_9BURK|nr:hypothetical protein [Massilia frigida]NHZ81436.1 hypothetical protein [Massilia frigida]
MLLVAGGRLHPACGGKMRRRKARAGRHRVRTSDAVRHGGFNNVPAFGLLTPKYRQAIPAQAVFQSDDVAGRRASAGRVQASDREGTEAAAEMSVN